jgi:hypothetical protein
LRQSCAVLVLRGIKVINGDLGRGD